VRHGQGLFLQSHCISTIPGGHVARERPWMGRSDASVQRSCKYIPVVTLPRVKLLPTIANQNSSITENDFEYFIVLKGFSSNLKNIPGSSELNPKQQFQLVQVGYLVPGRWQVLGPGFIFTIDPYRLQTCFQRACDIEYRVVPDI